MSHQEEPTFAKFKLTPQHEDIVEFVREGKGNFVIEAVAGSGKTTTLEYLAWKVIPRDCHAVFVAFNKSVAAELAGRMPPEWQCKTFHGLCFGALRNTFKSAKVEAGKMGSLMRFYMSDEERQNYYIPVGKLVGLAKSHGLIPNTPSTQEAVPSESLLPDTTETWDHLISKFAVDIPDIPGAQEQCIKIARGMLEISLTEVNRVDFDDMLYHTFAYKIALRKPDWLLIDEGQDTNALQGEIARRMLGKKTRLGLVGDPFQAIYGFRGAESDAMGKLTEVFKAKTFPLSVSYRCPVSVVETAQKLAPHIRHRDGAPQGTIETTETDKVKWVAKEDLVVCRNNAPLVKLAYRMIRDGIPAVVMGRDIGGGVVATMKKIGGRNYATISTVKLSEMLDRYEAKEVEKLVQMEKWAQADTLTDKCETLRVFLENGDTGRDVERNVKAFFDDQEKNGAVTLASVHKSKGLEAKRLVLLEPHLIPSKWAKQPWMLEQERNLLYVAVTRSKDTLVYAPLSDGSVKTSESFERDESNAVDNIYMI